MNVVFFHGAEDDFHDAVSYYDGEEAGLGDEFAQEVRAAIERICASPRAWRPLSKRVRKHLTHRFPFGIYYQFIDDTVFIVAVLHWRRHPDTWKSVSNDPLSL
jgi:plasmid stabilization system protein ParE